MEWSDIIVFKAESGPSTLDLSSRLSAHFGHALATAYKQENIIDQKTI